jgi:mycothiol synthase
VSEVTLRPPRREEAPRLTRLVNELGQALHGEDLADAAEVEMWLSSPGIDLEQDLVVAELPGGELVGFGALLDLARDHAILWLRVTLHPAHASAELADLLLAPLERRASVRGVEGSLLHAGCSGEDAVAKALYQRHGYRFVRHFLRMLIDLDEEPAEPLWPDGLELRPLDPDRHLELVHQADEEAFQDHWGAVRTAFSEWRHFMTSAHFDPSLWFVVWDGDEIAGFSLCYPREAGDAELGWVGVLGVRRPWRRRGLALALLLHSFGELRRRGLKRAGLGVDAESLTGALTLYEKAGMRIVRRFEVWEKHVSAIPRT